MRELNLVNLDSSEMVIKRREAPKTAVQVRSTGAGSFVIPWIDGGLVIISVVSVWLWSRDPTMRIWTRWSSFHGKPGCTALVRW